MKSLLILYYFLLLPFLVLAQEQKQNSPNPLNTSLNFLTIVPDARGASLGMTGAATSPDCYSLYWNPAKLSFIPDEFGAEISYAPWLTKIAKGMGLASFDGYKKMSTRSVLGLDIRYFSLGKTQFIDENGYDIYKYSPTEYTVGITYAQQLTDYSGIGITIRYIRSQPALGIQYQGLDVKTANAVGSDIGFYFSNVPYNQTDNWGNTFRAGVVLQNLGSKVKYYQTSDPYFQPMNLKAGISYTFIGRNNNNNSFTISGDINKYLVPTPPIYDSTGQNIVKGKDPNVSVPIAIFSSWADAPGGFSEEIKEFSLGIGMEYCYNNFFFLRGGLYYENQEKGNRQVATAGLGIKTNGFNMDISYFIPYSANQNQLGQTFKISLGLNFTPY